MKERTFTITAPQMAALLMLSVSIGQIIEAGKATGKLIKELQQLRPELDTITETA